MDSREMGRIGGRARARNHSVEQLAVWGRKAGIASGKARKAQIAARTIIIRAIGRVARAEAMTYKERRQAREKLERILVYLRHGSSNRNAC